MVASVNKESAKAEGQNRRPYAVTSARTKQEEESSVKVVKVNNMDVSNLCLKDSITEFTIACSGQEEVVEFSGGHRDLGAVVSNTGFEAIASRQECACCLQGCVPAGGREIERHFVELGLQAGDRIGDHADVQAFCRDGGGVVGWERGLLDLVEARGGHV